jgi:hypothetical protein
MNEQEFVAKFAAAIATANGHPDAPAYGREVAAIFAAAGAHALRTPVDHDAATAEEDE